MVDFALQLLHVAMRDILVAWVLLITFAILHFKLSLSIGNLLVNVLNNSVDVLPLANLNQNLSLEVKHGLLNNSVIEVDHVT